MSEQGGRALTADPARRAVGILAGGEAQRKPPDQRPNPNAPRMGRGKFPPAQDSGTPAGVHRMGGRDPGVLPPANFRQASGLLSNRALSLLFPEHQFLIESKETMITAL